MRSKTTKLRHERSNPNHISRVVDFSECWHKIYHHVWNFELILNIFLKNWCGRRRPSYDMDDPTLTLTVGLWTFQNVDTKHIIMCGILSWFWIYFEKLMRSKTTKLRHERSNPNHISRVVDFSECWHKIYHHVWNFELILNIFLKNWCGRRRPSYDMDDPTLTLTVGLWTFQNVDTKHIIMCGILSWFWIYFWKIDAVEDDQVTTWTIQP